MDEHTHAVNISGCGQHFAHAQLWPYQFNASSARAPKQFANAQSRDVMTQPLVFLRVRIGASWVTRLANAIGSPWSPNDCSGHGLRMRLCTRLYIIMDINFI